MKKKWFILIFGIFFMSSIVPVIAKEWRGIIPLHSTRQDVEKKFGVKSNGKRYEEFMIGTDKVGFLYSIGRCEKREIGGDWNVPIDTVLEIQVQPQSTIQLSNLGIDLSKFDVTESIDLYGHRYYSDWEVGFIISVYEDIVLRFTYRPKAEDRKLFCP